MMAAVAIVAVALTAGRLAERRASFLERAAVEADRANDFVMGRACLKEEYDTEGMSNRLRDHDFAMARKYRLAASRPWRPVGPDPPLPTP